MHLPLVGFLRLMKFRGHEREQAGALVVGAAVVVVVVVPLVVAVGVGDWPCCCCWLLNGSTWLLRLASQASISACVALGEAPMATFSVHLNN